MNQLTFSGKHYIELGLSIEEKSLCKNCTHCLCGSSLKIYPLQNRGNHIKDPAQCAPDTDMLMHSLTGKGTQLSTLCGGRFYKRKSIQLELFQA